MAEAPIRKAPIGRSADDDEGDDDGDDPTASGSNTSVPDRVRPPSWRVTLGGVLPNKLATGLVEPVLSKGPAGAGLLTAALPAEAACTLRKLLERRAKREPGDGGAPVPGVGDVAPGRELAVNKSCVGEDEGAPVAPELRMLRELPGLVVLDV